MEREVAGESPTWSAPRDRLAKNAAVIQTKMRVTNTAAETMKVR